MEKIILNSINKEKLNELLEVEKENMRLMSEYYSDTFTTFDDEQSFIYIALDSMLERKKKYNEALKELIKERKRETTNK